MSRAAFTLIAFCWARAALGAPAQPGPLPPTEVRDYRLANGLRVLLAPDGRERGVGVAVVYATGHGDDPPGYRGMAHLAEHLTFRASRHLRPFEGVTQLETRGVGFQGMTTAEHTIYATTGFARDLPTMLWLEGERMAFAVAGIDAPALEAEKRVVVAELGQRGHGMTGRDRLRKIYGAGHPFAPIDDEPADVDAISLPGLQRHMQAVYRPDNATLAIVGAFSADEARALVEKTFGTIRSAPLPRLGDRAAPAPRPCGGRLKLGHGSLVGKRLAFDWTVARPRTVSQQVAWKATQEVLRLRLKERLVDARPRVATTAIDVSPYRSHARVSIDIEMLDPADWEGVEAAVREETRRLAREGASDDVLRIVRGLLLSRLVFSLENATNRAITFAMGEAPDVDVERNAIVALDRQSVQSAAGQLRDEPLVTRAEPLGGRPVTVVSDETTCP